MYKCDFCNVLYQKDHHLARHKTHNHDKQKDFKCQSCDMTFYKQDCLENNTSGVHATKSYQCDFCNVGYDKDEHLPRHNTWNHQKHKDFKC